MRLLFRGLSYLYPPSFRRRYSEDLDAAFGLLAKRADGTRRARLRLLLELLRDFTLTLPRAWWTHGVRARRRTRLSPYQESSPMQTLLTEIRYAFRRLLKKPALALTAVVALGLGIGLTTAMFSIVNGVLLEGLPIEEQHELLSLARIRPAEGPNRLINRAHDFVDLRERQTTFEDLAGANFANMNVSPPGQPPEFVNGAEVTASLFALAGTPALLGRTFTEAEDRPGAEPVVVLGHRFWRDRFEADPGIVGRTIRVNGEQSTVIGVMPPEFEFPINQDMWQPLRLDVQGVARGQAPVGVPFAFGRLRDGVTPAQGQADLARIMSQLAEEYPETNEGMTVVSGAYVREILGFQLPPFLFTMLGAVSLVLVIACANVANLLLARASLRSREVALCTALGASRGRTFGQLLLEASIIASLGALLGIGVARVGVGLFNGALAGVPQGMPFWFSIDIDPSVLGFVLVLTVLASLASGVAPALQASGTQVNEILKDSSRGSSLRMGRLSRALVVLEVALSCALLVGSGLMVKSVANLATEDYAFEEEGLFTALVVLPPADYPDPTAHRQAFEQIAQRVESLPGVESVAVGTDLPAVGSVNGRFAIEGEVYQTDSDYPSSRLSSVSPTYFGTLGARVLEGRGFNDADGPDSRPVAVVNQSFADEYFAGRSALGERLAIRAVFEPQGATERNDEIFYTVVGVVADMYLDGQAFILPVDAIYTSFAQRPSSGASLIVRGPGDPLALTSSVREAVAGFDPDLPIAQVSTLAQAIRDTQFMLQLFSTMFTIFGAVALFLAAIGLYGVLAFSVTQRMREVGIRVALGATSSNVMSMIIKQGLKQLVLGLVIGLGMALGLARLLSFVLYQVGPADPLVFGGIALVLLAVGLTACLLPARRATRVDPLVAMRAD